jgi:MOSC domain-containing protein
MVVFVIVFVIVNVAMLMVVVIVVVIGHATMVAHVGDLMRVASLHTYPVKGCHGVNHARATIEPRGLRGDRYWMIVEAGTHRTLTQREQPRLTALRPLVTETGLLLRSAGAGDLEVKVPAGVETAVVNGCEVAFAGAEADAWLSDALGQPVRLVFQARPVAVDAPYGRPGDVTSLPDTFPVLIASLSSLAALNDWIAESGSNEGPVPMTRFRPNIVVDGGPAWAEDGWIARRIRVGGVTFRAPKPCARCVVTTTDQETGERGHEPLRTLARHRNVNTKLLFATNLIPDDTGDVAIGDEVSLLPD